MNEPISSAQARASLLVWMIALAVPWAGCGEPSEPAIVLATTTSVDDSGLLGHLLSAYSANRPSARIRPLAVGSGEALELGRRGDADLLIVHTPVAEEDFMANGHGEARVPIMYNEFVVVGPPDDPAGVADVGTPGRALRAIAEAGQPFLSRGDESGTHRREQQIWQDAGTRRAPSWYLEAGQGMGPLLQMASERRAYTLSDRATFYAMQPKLDLAVLYEGDPLLRNVYSVILVRGAGAKPAAGELFQWLTSDDGAEAISAYRDGSGRQLFNPVPPAPAAWEAPSLPPGTRAESAATTHTRSSAANDSERRHGLSNLRRRLLCRSAPPRLTEEACE